MAGLDAKSRTFPRNYRRGPNRHLQRRHACPPTLLPATLAHRSIMQLNQAKNLSYFKSPFYLGIELQHPEAYLPRARLPVEFTMAVLKH